MKHKRVIKRLGNLFGSLPHRRVSDDDALDFLCDCLDSGVPPGTVSPISREPWSVVLRRRVSNKYRREKSQVAIWSVRHFHVRQLAAFNESHRASAAHVAQIWTAAGHNVNAKGLIDAAERKTARKEALEWIDESEKWIRRICPYEKELLTTAFVYSGLEANIAQIAEDLRPSKKVK